MAENEKDVPIKEQEDGSVLAKVEFDEHFDESEDKKPEPAPEPENNDDSDADDDHDDEDDEDDGQEDPGTDDDRERIREARREERKLKKELKKQRDISAQNKIKALERRNAELAERLLKVENTTTSYQFAQLDKAIEDEATKVEYAKLKMLQAAQEGNAAAQMDFLEQLTDAKDRLKQVQFAKKQQLEAAKAPKQNVPNEISSEVQRLATNWLKKNSWYDPQSRDTDSRIAKVIDQELVSDGWDPADPEYWEELDSRLQSRLPHRYVKASGERKPRSPGPTASSRVANTATAKPGTITLSRDRVQAIKDAGAWDNVERRNKMIRAYAQYDRENKG